MAQRKAQRTQATSASSPVVQFKDELEVFRKDVESALQFLYGYLTVHAVARDTKSVYQSINNSLLFWNTNLGALQTSAFIALGRVFDQNSTHNLDHLLRIAQAHRHIFSKQALRLRKQEGTRLTSAELDQYMRTTGAATATDVRRWRSQIKSLRKIYEARYRTLRHEVFAHNVVADASTLFAQTNIRELQRLLLKLRALYEELWQLFFNGRKRRYRIGRYSIHMMRTKPSPKMNGRPVHERMVYETERLLKNNAQAAGEWR